MTTIQITATNAKPSTCCDAVGAMDYDLTITVDGVQTETEATLAPSQYDGTLGMWGDLDMWLGGRGVALVQGLGLDRHARRRLLGEIVAVCRSGEDSEIEVRS